MGFRFCDVLPFLAMFARPCRVEERVEARLATGNLKKDAATSDVVIIHHSDRTFKASGLKPKTLKP